MRIGLDDAPSLRTRLWRTWSWYEEWDCSRSARIKL